MTKDSFKLQIITPTGVIFDEEVNAISAKNKQGPLSVLPAHANFISLIEGKVEVYQGKEKKDFDVASGIIHVQKNSAAIFGGLSDLGVQVEPS